MRTARIFAFTAVASACLAGACGEGGGSGWEDGPGAPGHGAGQGTNWDGSTAAAFLEIRPLDLWAQTLPSDEAKLEIVGPAGTIHPKAEPKTLVPLPAAGSYRVVLTAPDHDDLEATVAFDGTSALTGAVVKTKDGVRQRAGLLVGHETREIGGRKVAVHPVWMGLRHQWFSAAGRPARRGNEIQLLMNGEEAWTAVAADLRKAKDTVHMSTWWWVSDFELIRPAGTHVTMTAAQRRENTILTILEKSAAYKRVLVGQWWGQDSIATGITVDDGIIAHGKKTGDRFEYMGIANPTRGKFHFKAESFHFVDRVHAAFGESRTAALDGDVEIPSTLPEQDVDLTQWPIGVDIEAASHHQKYMVIDHELAYVGGMNVRLDWDTSEHRVFEPRRMNFDASTADRKDVAAKKDLPDRVPRRDYLLRILGPAAEDVSDVFEKTWAHQRDLKVDYSENTTPAPIRRGLAPRPGGKQIQITTTMPQPFWEHSIAETWLNAVSHATRFIFIEDQYFRAPMLSAAIAARMREVPSLKLVVITSPIDEWGDMGCAWTNREHQALKAEFPDRYARYQLRSFDWVVTWGFDETEARFVDVNLHSKLMIVDDKFLCIGSANKNNRGMIYEAEMNVATLDPDFARAARRRILANFLPQGTSATDDLATWWNQLRGAAAFNDAVYKNWDDEGMDIDLDGDPMPPQYQPRGLLYTLSPRTLKDCLFESVGPDQTAAPAAPPPEEDAGTSTPP